MKRKFLASLLALCMVLTAVPGAWAVEGTGGDTGLEETESAENAAITVDGTDSDKALREATPTNPGDVRTFEELKQVLTEAASAGSGDTTINILADITLAEGESWQSVNVDGYHGAGVLTINGNDHTITGLDAPLFSGGFAGNSGVVINSLTIADATIEDKTNDQGIGAFISCVDSMPKISLNDCHFVNSTITSTAGARVGGLIGWTSGYNNQNDGPVDTKVDIVNCSVVGCTITANGSVGGIIGHAGANPATYHKIADCTVKNCELTSTDNGGWRVGVVVGTANVGEVTIDNITENGNTVEQTGKTAPEGQSTLYGRFVPNGTGALTIDGEKIFTGDVVAVVDGEGYKTLAAAIEAIDSKGKITLLRDTKENVTIPEGKTITLDLNGCTLNGGTGNNKPALTNNGIVTITDSKTGGTIKREDVNIGSGCHYVVDNQGEMTIEDGEIYNDSGAGKSGSSLIRNSSETNTAGATLNIVDGTFQQDDFIVIKNDDYGILNISGGTFNSKNDQVIQNWNVATITGGEMNGEVITWSWKEVPNNAKMTLSGGVVDGNVEAINYYYGDSYSECAPEVEISGEACVKGSLGTYAWKDGGRIATDTLAKLTVNGGHFVEDPSDYVAAGLAALKSHKAGYTYEVRKPATYTVTFTTDHGTAPEQVVETETFADTVITLPAAPAVEGYTFLGWALDGKTYTAGEKYTVTKDVTFTAKWAENVDTPVVDEEVVILPSAPVVPQPDTAGKPQAEAEAMKDMAEALQQPGAVEVEGLTDAAKDEIRDAAAAADKNEAFQKIVKEAQDKDPTAEITTTIVLEPYMDIQVKDAQVDGDKIAVELELTPMVKAKATIDPQHMTEVNTVVLYTQEMNVTETVTITLPLPDVFAGNTENLYVKHETEKKTYYYDTTVEDGKVTFENPHGFSTFTLVTDDRYAEVQLGDLLCEFFPSDVGMSLDMEDAYDAPRGEYFVGWKFDGISGVHDTLTDELLTKLAEKYSEDGKAVQAKPVFDEKSSGGSVDRGYAIRVEKTENGKVTAPSSATAGSTVTIKVKPDAGYQLDELVVTDKDGDELKLTDKGNGKFTFKMPKSKVTVEATFVEIDREPEVQELPFVDVADTAYYADAVRWAVAEGITGGTSAATFSPNAACTRAQAVTFLWRAAGSPVVNYAMGFTDVPADAYYAEAVRWAVSQGITTGATETTFAPDAPCTRAQIVTFIYRNVKAQGGGFTGSWMFPCPFTDVSADAYYFESVQWCVMKGITEGATETTFAPNATCTRAQIVTFLYRGAEK